MDRYYFGQGSLYASIRSVGGVPQGFTPIGDVSTLEIALGSQIALYATAGGETPPWGVDAGEPPSFTMVIDNFSSENVARVLYGLETDLTSQAISAEVVTAYQGKYVPLANMNLSSFTSLTHSSGSPVYLLGRDYTVELNTGMLFVTSTGLIANAQSLRANYVRGAQVLLSVGTIAPPFLWLRYNGINIADQNLPVTTDIYKVRFNPLAALPLIGSGLVPLAVTGRIFRDETMPDNTTDGRWFRMRRT